MLNKRLCRVLAVAGACVYSTGVANVVNCTCANGMAAQANCSEIQANRCSSCDAGYHLSSNACELNDIHCDLGYRPNGTECQRVSLLTLDLKLYTTRPIADAHGIESTLTSSFIVAGSQDIISVNTKSKNVDVANASHKVDMTMVLVAASHLSDEQIEQHLKSNLGELPSLRVSTSRGCSDAIKRSTNFFEAVSSSCEAAFLTPLCREIAAYAAIEQGFLDQNAAECGSWCKEMIDTMNQVHQLYNFNLYAMLSCAGIVGTAFLCCLVCGGSHLCDFVLSYARCNARPNLPAEPFATCMYHILLPSSCFCLAALVFQAVVLRYGFMVKGRVQTIEQSMLSSCYNFGDTSVEMAFGQTIDDVKSNLNSTIISGFVKAVLMFLAVVMLVAAGATNLNFADDMASQEMESEIERKRPPIYAEDSYVFGGLCTFAAVALIIALVFADFFGWTQSVKSGIERLLADMADPTKQQLCLQRAEPRTPWLQATVNALDCSFTSASASTDFRYLCISCLLFLLLVRV